MLLQLEQKSDHRCNDYHEYRRNSRQESGRPPADAQMDQKGLQPTPDPTQETQGGGADDTGRSVYNIESAEQRQDDLEEGLTMRFNTQNVLKLTGRYQNTGRGNEAGDHGERQKVHQETQTERTHGQQDQARQQRQRDGSSQILG